MPKSHADKKMYSTLEEEIEHRLRYSRERDYDMEVLTDKETLLEMYEAAGSLESLGEELDLAAGTVRGILEIHGIDPLTPGGSRGESHPDGFFRPKDNPVMMLRSVGEQYSWALKVRIVVNLHTDTCFAACPLWGYCWDAAGGRHKKKDDCGLHRHARLTLGVGNGHS